MTDTTVIIKTLGRPTLQKSVDSALREGFTPLVISDGASVSVSGCEVVKLGKNWGFYGGMAANVGAALAPTEFITFLDDDDVFVEGAGDVIREKLKSNQEIDIWVAGVRFNNAVTLRDPQTQRVWHHGTDLCMHPKKGVIPGNVAMPTYRRSIFAKIPFTDTIPQQHLNYTDFFHVKTCHDQGYKIAWFEQVIYLVRPDAEGSNGRGGV